jgi:hypothetical protein
VTGGDTSEKNLRQGSLGFENQHFAIGFLIPMCRIPVPPFVAGAIVGVLISLPDAIITKSYGPILISGLIGGTIIGWAAGRFGASVT